MGDIQTLESQTQMIWQRTQGVSAKIDMASMGMGDTVMQALFWDADSGISDSDTDELMAKNPRSVCRISDTDDLSTKINIVLDALSLLDIGCLDCAVLAAGRCSGGAAHGASFRVYRPDLS